jgi:hypothetical protein
MVLVGLLGSGSHNVALPMTSTLELPPGYLQSLYYITSKEKEHIDLYNEFNGVSVDSNSKDASNVINNTFIPNIHTNESSLMSTTLRGSVTAVNIFKTDSNILFQPKSNFFRQQQGLSFLPKKLIPFLNNGNASFKLKTKLVSNVVVKTVSVLSLLKGIYFCQDKEETKDKRKDHTTEERMPVSLSQSNSLSSLERSRPVSVFLSSPKYFNSSMARNVPIPPAPQLSLEILSDSITTKEPPKTWSFSEKSYQLVHRIREHIFTTIQV